MATERAVGRRVLAGLATGGVLVALRGTYSGILRRLDDLEHLVEVAVPAKPGCPTCWEWPEIAVVFDEEVAQSEEEGPWPASLVCPGCEREPRTVIQVRYEEHWPPGAERVVHLEDPPVEGRYPTS